MFAIVSDRSLATKHLMRGKARRAADAYNVAHPDEHANYRIREIGSRFYVVISGVRFAGWLQGES